MTEAEALAMLCEHVEGLFPKACPGCHRHFATYREFARCTEPSGLPTSYDLESGNLNPLNPVGAVSFSKCPCGTTLTLSSQGMPAQRLWMLLVWGQSECERRGLKPGEFLDYLRREVRRRALAGRETDHPPQTGPRQFPPPPS
jgi:hypothetical protein